MVADKPATKSQIVSELAAKTGAAKNQVKTLLDALAALACAETKHSGSCIIPGLGKLVLVDRKARKGRNPATGEEIDIPAKTAVKFRVAKTCKDAVLGT